MSKCACVCVTVACYLLAINQRHSAHVETHSYCAISLIRLLSVNDIRWHAFSLVRLFLLIQSINEQMLGIYVIAAAMRTSVPLASTFRLLFDLWSWSDLPITWRSDDYERATFFFSRLCDVHDVFNITQRRAEKLPIRPHTIHLLKTFCHNLLSLLTDHVHPIRRMLRKSMVFFFACCCALATINADDIEKVL